MTNMYRRSLGGDEVRLMWLTMVNILEAIVEYLGLPPEFRDVIEQEITYYDPRLQISKSRPYRRIYNRRPVAPFFYGVLALYIFQFGAFVDIVRKTLAAKGQPWMISGPLPMAFGIHAQQQPRRRDLPFTPDGKAISNIPLFFFSCCATTAANCPRDGILGSPCTMAGRAGR
ncbi:hypothetical protein F4782DRAFT_148347 [Xylaria castorea]|nr:hypothetical protein F4782DRAFT_148347 [Xylaria castorea]